MTNNNIPQNTNNWPDGPSTRLLTRTEVAEVYGLSKRWLEVAATKGQGPPMVRISARMVRYRACDIEAWIEARVTSGAPEDASPAKRGR